MFRSGSTLVLDWNDQPDFKRLVAEKESGMTKIVHNSTGHENVPEAWIKKLGVTREWLPGYSSDSVAELGIFLMLLAARTIWVRNKSGSHTIFFKRGTELEGKTALVVGSMGAIGSALCRKLKGLGLSVIDYDAKDYVRGSRENLFKWLGMADIVFVCIPVEGNKRFLNYTLLKKCSRSPILINLSRKTLVRSEIINVALKRQFICSYLVDDETMAIDSRIFGTGHVGANTFESRDRQQTLLHKKIEGKE